MQAPIFLSGVSRRSRRCLLILVGLALTCVPVGVASASAPIYQQLRLFEEPSIYEPPNPTPVKASRLESAAGLAVNLTGAGGVAPGTLYGLARSQIVRYSPAGVYEAILNKEAVESASGLAIDQATGEIYVANGTDIVRLSAGGTVLEAFGERTLNLSDSIEATPQAFHQKGGIAVDDNGVVYVGDGGYASAENPQASRVMVFEPETAGTHEHYVYAGRGRDIARGGGGVQLALDAHGNLFVDGDETFLREYSLANPNTPLCELTTSGSVNGVAVDPLTSEFIYLSGKDHQGHQLLCNSLTGTFEALGSFPVTPAPTSLYSIPALAVNPSLVIEESRPPGVLYTASNSGAGYLFAKPAHHEPVVESEGVTEATSTAAAISAKINPHGAIGRYVFEYLPETAYEENEPGNRFQGATLAPVDGATMPSGAVSVVVGASLSGLTPGTRYRYRVVLSGGEGGPVAGAPKAFVTYPTGAPGLPDGRGYELVSPIEKRGGEVIPPMVSCFNGCTPGSELAHFPMQSSLDGEALVYEGTSFSPGKAAAVENEYIARRSDSGWQTTWLSPSLAPSGSGSGYKSFTPTLDRGVLYQSFPALSAGAPSEHPSLYVQSTGDPLAPTSLLGPEAEQTYHRTGHGFEPVFAGGSSDLSKVVFEADDALTAATPVAPEAVDGGEHANNVYEWTEGQLRLVNVLPGNTQTIPGAAVGAGIKLVSFGLATNSPPPVVFHAVSENGSRIFWTSPAGRLYARLNAEETVPVGPEGACANSLPEAQRTCFATASADGSEVLLSNGQLYALNTQTDSYEASGDITEGKGGLRGIAGQSQNHLSSLYFVDEKVLGGTNGLGESATGGADNLYVSHDGTVAFIATLVSRDGLDWAWETSVRRAEASPDGNWLAFQSIRPLTGYDNVGPCEHQGSVGEYKTINGDCEEVFLYDRESGQTVCVSCNRSLSAPSGNSSVPVMPNAPGAASQLRYVTDSGRVYFNSGDSLIPADTNKGIVDVYEYEPAGVGSCGEVPGCVSLMSGGHGSGDSQFLAADVTGKNVFLATRDQLVGADRDELFDVYDAREGGGNFAQSPGPARECSGENCQGSPPQPQSEPEPGSLAFSGAENVLSQTLAPAKQKPKTVIRRRELQKTLSACKKKPRHRRLACERVARRKYGASATKAKIAGNHQQEAR